VEILCFVLALVLSRRLSGRELEGAETTVHNQRMSTNRVAGQIKLSAVKAGLFASMFFLMCLFVAALWDLLHLALDQKLRMSWRMDIGLAGTLSGVAFAAMFVSTFFGPRTSDYHKETAVRSFGATVFIQIFWASAGPAVLLFWGLGGFGDKHDPILMLGLSLSIGLAAFFRWPRTITLDELAISQRSLFGIRRTIPYSEVEYIRYEPKKQMTFVVGPAVTTIKHTPSHSDQALFQSLLQERTRKQVQVER
jgi:hypothetical protein